MTYDNTHRPPPFSLRGSLLVCPHFRQTRTASRRPGLRTAAAVFGEAPAPLPLSFSCSFFTTTGLATALGRLLPPCMHGNGMAVLPVATSSYELVEPVLLPSTDYCQGYLHTHGCITETAFPIAAQRMQRLERCNQGAENTLGGTAAQDNPCATAARSFELAQRLSEHTQQAWTSACASNNSKSSKAHMVIAATQRLSLIASRRKLLT